MTKFIDPTSPHWRSGTEDTRLVDFESAVTRRFIHPGETILDVGAGEGTESRKLFPIATRCDLYPSDGVQQFNLLTDLLADRYDSVHARRVITNLPRHARKTALEKLLAARAPRGQLLIVDTWGPARENVDALRKELGLDPLAPPGHGVGPLLPEELPCEPTLVVPIGVDYFLWTRALYPALFERDCPYTDYHVRRIAPARWLSPELEMDYAVHRLMIWYR